MLDQLYAALPVFAQNWACTWAGYRRARLRFGPHFHATLADWQRTGQGPLEELWGIQRRRLDRLVLRARTQTGHYATIAEPSAARDDRQALEETLAALPVLEKAAYREHPDAFLARDLRKSHLLQGKTSGTTGTALPLWYTRETQCEEYATVWRQLLGAGVKLDDPSLTFNGQIIVPFGVKQPPFWRWNGYRKQTLFSLYHMTRENLPAYVDAIHRTDATHVTGYPSAMFLAARAMLDADRPLPAGRVRAVYTSSETLLAFQRETLEAAFNAPVLNRYGVSELAVSMTECTQGNLHVDMEFCIVEVEVQREDDDSVTGALLVTGLANDATPFIRYRIGDVGTRLKQPCPCGRPGDTFSRIDGRIEDYVVTPDGRRVGRLDHVFKDLLDIAEAQVLQETADAIEVLIVPRASYDTASERQLLKEIRARLGHEIRVDLRRVDEIPREPNGKFRAVKSAVGRIAP